MLRGDISLPEGDNDGVTNVRSGDEAITRWQYFADSNQAVIRVPITDDPGRRGERYWGHSAGWIAASPGCADWADEATNSRYRQGEWGGGCGHLGAHRSPAWWCVS